MRKLFADELNESQPRLVLNDEMKREVGEQRLVCEKWVEAIGWKTLSESFKLEVLVAVEWPY